MTILEKRRLARDALRRKFDQGSEPWGAGKPYASIFTVSEAIANLYWHEIENAGGA